MTKQIINVGVIENDRRGDPVRIAFQKSNENFTELYTSVAALSDVAFSGSYNDLLNKPTVLGATDRLINGDNQLIFGADGSLTLPSGSPILFGNGNSRIQAGMGFHINSEEGISLEAVNIADPLNPISYGWYFSPNGTLTLPAGGDILNNAGSSVLAGAELIGAGVPQVGSILTIADNGTPGGLVGWSPQALSVAYDANIISTYPVGSTITFQDTSVATITQIDDYGPAYIDIFWDTPKTGDLFPIKLKTANYVAALPVRARITATDKQWTFDVDGGLTFPGGSRIETQYGGDTRLMLDGTTQNVEIRSASTILIGFNNSSGNVFIGNQNSGQVDIVGPKFRFFCRITGKQDWKDWRSSRTSGV